MKQLQKLDKNIHFRDKLMPEQGFDKVLILDMYV